MSRRPTPEDLTRALALFEELGYGYDERTNRNGFIEVVTQLDLLHWLDTEVAYARNAAAYPPGSDAHTIGRFDAQSPVEGRFQWGNGRHPILRDPVVRALENLRGGWNGDLNRRNDQWMTKARETVNWPERTRQSG